MEQLPTINGRVDEAWLDGVLRENALRSSRHAELTPEFGAVCIRFTDAVLNDGKMDFCKLDKLTKAEVCSIVYLHVCRQAAKYDPKSCSKPSNWVYTLVKNRMINAVNEVLNSDEVSKAVAAVVGRDALDRMDGIARNAPANRVLSERNDALREFCLNRGVKETLFTQAWRDSWFRRDGKTVLQRAKHHRRLQAVKVSGQVSLSDSDREELKKLIEERRNGRTGRT